MDWHDAIQCREDEADVLTNPHRSPDTRFLARLFSVETIGAVIAAAFAFGMGYNALAASDQQNAVAIKSVETKVSELSGKQSAISDDVQDIKIDVATIKANQANQAEQQRQAREDIQRILRILQYGTPVKP